jgi:hypothetical protein
MTFRKNTARFIYFASCGEKCANICYNILVTKVSQFVSSLSNVKFWLYEIEMIAVNMKWFKKWTYFYVTYVAVVICATYRFFTMRFESFSKEINDSSTRSQYVLLTMNLFSARKRRRKKSTNTYANWKRRKKSTFGIALKEYDKTLSRNF